MRKITCILFLIFAALSAKAQTIKVLGQQIESHPRLLFTAEKEAEVRNLIETNELAEQLYTRLLQEADSVLLLPLIPYALDSSYVPTLLKEAREEVYRLTTLSLAWRMTQKKAYLDKVEKELVNVCNYPNWNPRHFLDVAEMTTAVSIAYDWLYNVLSPEVKELVVKSIKEKALPHAVKEYKEGGPGSWAKRGTNWNVVCNTGMVLGAMAIAEENPVLTGEIIEEAVHYLPNCLKHFAPDGVWYEGPAYWGYTCNYLSLLLCALNDNFKDDFGLSKLPGMDKTALYYIHSISPSGKVFNFANSGSNKPDLIPAYFFFSRHFNQPQVAEYYRKILAEELQKEKLPRWDFFLSLPWFDASKSKKNHKQAKLNVYKSINDIAVFTGNKKKENSIYLIAKGGDPDEAHQQMDVGTFIVETDHIRWSDDLGSDYYTLPGFWDGRPDGKRWQYFRNNNFSHNTLSIDGKLQYSGGTGKIIDYDNTIKQPWFTIDMTTVYKDQATKVHRTFRLINEQTVTIKDDIEFNEADHTITWNMITSADIVCDANVARLTKDGKNFYLKINTPDNAVFQVSSIPPQVHEKEYPIAGFRLLQVIVKCDKYVNINITMTNKK